MAYRIYVTDCLKGLSGASARYIDLIDEDDADATDENPEDIKKRLLQKLGGNDESTRSGDSPEA